jgi:exodeoxyribonuclease-3
LAEIDVPNSGSKRLEYRVEWERAFREQLRQIECQKPVIWCGDLNVAHNEIDLAKPKTSTKSPGFTQEERQCFTDLLSDGYFDAFRYLYPDLTGGKTLCSAALAQY